MFRLVNKTATAFNGLGGAYRAIRDNIKQAGKATKKQECSPAHHDRAFGRLVNDPRTRLLAAAQKRLTTIA